MLPFPMDPFLMPLMSHKCPSFHINSMLPTFSHHFPYSLVQRNFSLSRPLFSYLDFACGQFLVQLLVRAHLVHFSSSTLSSITEYLMLVDGGFPMALLPADSIPSTSDHLFWNRHLEPIECLETYNH